MNSPTPYAAPLPEMGRLERCRRQGFMVGYFSPECQTPEENLEAELRAATLNYCRALDGRVVTTSKTSIPELSFKEMLALTRRASLKSEVVTATDDDGDVVAQVMFVVGGSGPLGYTPVGTAARPNGCRSSVEQHCNTACS